MRIGARIKLNTELDTARGGLALLADDGWMMSLRQENERYRGHPAGGARLGLVAVMFGKPVPSSESAMTLPVRWEVVEPGDEFSVLLDGDIILADDDDHAHRMLTLAGFCRIPADIVTVDGFEQARAQLAEAARTFITSVAATVIRAAGSGEEREALGTAWSWVNGGLPRANS